MPDGERGRDDNGRIAGRDKPTKEEKILISQVKDQSVKLQTKKLQLHLLI